MLAAWAYRDRGAEPEADQGDTFDDVRLIARYPGAAAVIEHTGRAVVVSHPCEFTKMAKQRDRPLLVAPVIETDSLPDDQPTRARADKLVRYWTLPEVSPFAVGWCVDLAYIQPILAEHIDFDERVIGMDETGQLALTERINLFLSRRERV